MCRQMRIVFAGYAECRKSSMLKMLRRVGLSVVVGLLATSAQARTWRVPADAPTVQAGIDSAEAGDDVLLAPGTYTWTSEGASGFSMLHMKAGVTLHSEAGATATFLDAESQGRVLRCEDVGSEVIIEGLTIQNGRARRGLLPAETDVFGSGIFVSGNSNPTIRHCVIRDNLSFGDSNVLGGGIFCEVATIEDCEFLNNRASSGAGGSSGGGLFCKASRVTRCLFRDNFASGDGSANGGAMTSISAIVTDCVFENNESRAFQRVHGGAITEGGVASITSCLFVGNQTTSIALIASGGAVHVAEGTISDCILIANAAVGGARGGALSLRLASTVSGCVFIGNAARQDPAGSGFGGAIRSGEGGTIENCTFLGNSGGDADGVGGIMMMAGGTIRSVILAFTSVGQSCFGTATWSCSNLFGNSQGDFICGTDGGGNFSLDPEFCAVDPITTHNVTLQGDSPCAPGNHPSGASCGLIGAGAVACETVSAEQKTWSIIKNMFR